MFRRTGFRGTFHDRGKTFSRGIPAPIAELYGKGHRVILFWQRLEIRPACSQRRRNH